MRMNVYSIFDSAAAVYMRPFFMPSDSAAVRAFSDISCDAEHEVGKHPEDYSVHRIGYFDDQKGALVGEQPECLATALELVAKSRNVDRDRLQEMDMKVGGTA